MILNQNCFCSWKIKQRSGVLRACPILAGLRSGSGTFWHRNTLEQSGQSSRDRKSGGRRQTWIHLDRGKLFKVDRQIFVRKWKVRPEVRSDRFRHGLIIFHFWPFTTDEKLWNRIQNLPNPFQTFAKYKIKHRKLPKDF